jgi:UDP-N-acetylmuramyl pentapeptide phosphotransferase/UDP-N-acetylglucosamine-1-phosphate transferase
VFRGELGAETVLDALLVAGSANLVNLLDLRPGRALKAGVIAALALGVAAPPELSLALAVPTGAAVGLLPPDLRERAMLGDCGANALGAAIGAAVICRGGTVLNVIALAVVVVLTLVSEVVSFTKLIERSAPLRAVDRIGRLRDVIPSAHD